MPSNSSNITTCMEDEMTDVYFRQEIAIIPTTVILILCVLTYGLRIIARLLTKQRIWWDDIFMGFGLILSWEPAICQYLLVANGLGHHTCNVPEDQVDQFIRIAFALQRGNQPVLCCVKISILLFYHRVFNEGQNRSNGKITKFGICVIVGIIYTLIWGISTWIVTFTRCQPIALAYDWTMRKIVEGGWCRDPVLIGATVAILSLVGDIYIIVLPLPILARLNINKRKKAAVIGIFLLGSFGCIASIVRIFEIANVNTNTDDPTYTVVYAAAWTTLEQGIAIISGNLPMLSPLFRGYFGNNNNNNRGDRGGGDDDGEKKGRPIRNTFGGVIRWNSKLGRNRLCRVVRPPPNITLNDKDHRSHDLEKDEVEESMTDADAGSLCAREGRRPSATPLTDAALAHLATINTYHRQSGDYSLRDQEMHQYVATVSVDDSPLTPETWELDGFMWDNDEQQRTRAPNPLGAHPLGTNGIYVKRQVTVTRSSK